MSHFGELPRSTYDWLSMIIFRNILIRTYSRQTGSESINMFVHPCSRAHPSVHVPGHASVCPFARAVSPCARPPVRPSVRLAIHHSILRPSVRPSVGARHSLTSVCFSAFACHPRSRSLLNSHVPLLFPPFQIRPRLPPVCSSSPSFPPSSTLLSQSPLIPTEFLRGVLS